MRSASLLALAASAFSVLGFFASTTPTAIEPIAALFRRRASLVAKARRRFSSARCICNCLCFCSSFSRFRSSARRRFSSIRCFCSAVKLGLPAGEDFARGDIGADGTEEAESWLRDEHWEVGLCCIFGGLSFICCTSCVVCLSSRL